MNDDGSLTVFLAVVAFSLFMLVGLVVDGGRALTAREAAWCAAQEAARAGAGQLVVQDLRSGSIVVDPGAAQVAAEDYLADRGFQGAVNVVVADGVVTVDVSSSEPTAILGLIGIDRIAVGASASAIDVHGVTRED